MLKFNLAKKVAVPRGSEPVETRHSDSEQPDGKSGREPNGKMKTGRDKD